MKGITGHNARSSMFDYLAPEVILSIMANLCDLHTLYNLLAASPTALRTFHEYSVTVFESVLSGHQSLLPEEVRELIRAVVLTRSGCLPISSLKEFEFRFMRNRKIPQTTTNTPITLCRDSIPRETPATVLRDVVATARHLSVLTHTCLDYYLARTRNISTVESPPVESSPDAEPPSWVEEMRVTRALWTVQIICDLRKSAADGTLAAQNWPADDISHLLEAESGSIPIFRDPPHDELVGLIGNRFRGIRPQQEREEILTVLEYLQDIGRNDCIPWPPASMVSLKRQTPKPMEIEKIWGDVEYGYGERIGGQRQMIAPGKVPRHSDDFIWGQTRSNLLHFSPAVIYYRVILSHHDGGLLFDSPFDPYRHLGFAIWDQKRMHHLDLMDGAERPYYLPEHYAPAWRSLLSPQQVEQLEEKRAMMQASPLT